MATSLSFAPAPALARNGPTRVAAPIAGRLRAWLEPPGARVRAGQWLAIVGDDELDAALRRGRLVALAFAEGRTPQIEHAKAGARSLVRELDRAWRDLEAARPRSGARPLRGHEADALARRVDRLASMLAHQERLIAAAELDCAAPSRDGRSFAARTLREVVRAPIAGVLGRWLVAPDACVGAGERLVAIEPRVRMAPGGAAPGAERRVDC